MPSNELARSCLLSVSGQERVEVPHVTFISRRAVPSGVHTAHDEVQAYVKADAATTFSPNDIVAVLPNLRRRRAAKHDICLRNVSQMERFVVSSVEAVLRRKVCIRTPGTSDDNGQALKRLLQHPFIDCAMLSALPRQVVSTNDSGHSAPSRTARAWEISPENNQSRPKPLTTRWNPRQSAASRQCELPLPLHVGFVSHASTTISSTEHCLVSRGECARRSPSTSVCEKTYRLWTNLRRSRICG